MDEFEQKTRKGKTIHECPCCCRNKELKEPRCVSKRLASGKEPEYAPLGSSYIQGEPELSYHKGYIKGVSSWKKTQKKKNAIKVRMEKSRLPDE